MPQPILVVDQKFGITWNSCEVKVSYPGPNKYTATPIKLVVDYKVTSLIVIVYQVLSFLHN